MNFMLSNLLEMSSIEKSQLLCFEMPIDFIIATKLVTHYHNAKNLTNTHSEPRKSNPNLQSAQIEEDLHNLATTIRGLTLCEKETLITMVQKINLHK